jgi:hypothetical protein
LGVNSYANKIVLAEYRRTPSETESSVRCNFTLLHCDCIALPLRLDLRTSVRSMLQSVVFDRHSILRLAYPPELNVASLLANCSSATANSYLSQLVLRYYKRSHAVYDNL